MYATQDLIITKDFTLPEDASRAELERALAHFSGLTEVCTLPCGRVLFSHFRGKFTNKFLVMANDDDRSRESKLAACKDAGADYIFDPFVDPITAKLVVDRRLTINSDSGGTSGLVGTWNVGTKAISCGLYDIPSSNIAADEISVHESYVGYHLRETACRAALGLNGRFKDVYCYYSERHNMFRWIALNQQQKDFLQLRTTPEDFHRRLIWFPNLTKYAYILEFSGISINAEKLARLEARAKKALEDRKQYNKDDLFDFLDNYYYKGQGLLDKNRLKTGVIYVAP